MKKSITILVICLVSCFQSPHSQDSQVHGSLHYLPARSYNRMDHKTVSLQQSLEQQVAAYLKSLQKLEERLKKKIMRKDPFLAVPI